MKKTSLMSKLFSRFLICIIITLCLLIALKSNVEFRSFVYKNVFQDNLKFAKFDKLYQKYFGSVILSDDKALSVSKEKIEYKDLEDYKDGVKLKVSNNYAVPSIKSGIVTFIGEKEGYGNTVVVEDADGVESYYSNLNEINVSIYDYLKQSNIVGSASGELILSFWQEGKKVDYKKYI